MEVNLMNQDPDNEKQLIKSTTRTRMNSRKLSSLFETVRFEISFWTFRHDSWDYEKSVCVVVFVCMCACWYVLKYPTNMDAVQSESSLMVYSMTPQAQRDDTPT